jgi:2-methylcitrate dehydratase PrpD
VQEIRIYYNEDWYKVIGDLTLMPDVNLRYCMAVTMLDGLLTFDASHDAERMKATDVVAMGKRIQFLGPKPHLERFAARVEVSARGEVFAAEQGRDVLGRAENPMTKAQVQDKARELFETVLSSAKAQQAIDMVDRLDRVADVRELIALLRP